MARQRLDVNSAARLLGISTDAVRKRASRGTLESEKDADGSLYVWLDADAPPSGQRDDRDLLIEFLRSELALWQEEARRKDHIIAALTERIPELEPPSEPRESPVTAAEASGGGDVPPDGERRSWWRRFFGY